MGHPVYEAFGPPEYCKSDKKFIQLLKHPEKCFWSWKVGANEGNYLVSMGRGWCHLVYSVYYLFRTEIHKVNGLKGFIYKISFWKLRIKYDIISSEHIEYSVY